jgi:hypothetical protein
MALTVICPRACTARGTLSVDARTAKRLKLRGRVIGRSSPVRARRGQVRLRITVPKALRAKARLLRRGTRLTIAVRVEDPQAGVTRVRRTVRVR